MSDPSHDVHKLMSIAGDLLSSNDEIQPSTVVSNQLPCGLVFLVIFSTESETTSLQL